MQVSSIGNNNLYSQNEQPKSMVKSDKFPCPVNGCQLKYRYQCRLKDHLLVVHAYTKGYICNICNKSFKYSGSLCNHKKSHKPKEYTCTTCNKSYTNKLNLIQHAERHSHIVNLKIKKQKCKSCPEVFIKKKELIQHNKQCHPSVKLFACTDCNKIYYYQGALSRHYMAEHKAKKIRHYKCDICPEIVTKKKYLQDHHKQEHVGKCPYVCDICNKDFVSERGKARHKESIHADNSTLEINNKKTISNNNDNQHVTQDNNQDNICDLINDSIMFDTATKLKKDKAILDREQELNGESNRQTFFNKKGRRAHAKKSPKINLSRKRKTPYGCELCIEKFTSIEKQQQHYVTSHPSVKLYLCTFCNKKYAYRTSLRKHYIAYHKNKAKKIRHYKCDICPKIVTKKKYLQDHHKQEHVGKHPYVCDICNKDFVSERGKDRHKESKHANKIMLEINNKKTISNNNQDVAQDNNQYNLCNLINNSIMLDTETTLKKDNAMLDLEQELNEESNRRIYDSNFDDLISCI